MIKIAVFSTFALFQGTDNLIGVSVVPPTSIQNWSISFVMSLRYGGSGIYQAFASSGIANGQSGITITNAPGGQFSVNIPQTAISGLISSAYAITVARTDSGSATILAESFLNLLPS